MFANQIFMGKLDEFIRAMDVALNDPDLVFEVGTIPVTFQAKTVLQMRGNWDLSDIYFFSAIARLLRSSLDMLLSVDLNFDFTLAMDLVTRDYATMSAQQIADFLVETLYEIVSDPAYPNFLLSTEDASWRMPRAGIDLGYAAGDVVAAVRESYDPVGPLGYVVRIDNGVRDPSERLFFGDMEPLSAEMMEKMPAVLDILSAVQASLWDGTQKDLDPNAGNEFDLAVLNELLRGSPIAWLVKFPSTPVDLSAYFLDPHPEVFRDTLVSSLECLVGQTGFFHILSCLLG